MMGNMAMAKEGGIIQIEFEDAGKELQSRKPEFSCTKVAEYNNGKFVSEIYSEVGKIDQFSSANEMRNLARTLAEQVKKPDQTIALDTNGKATLESVSEGLYLFTASNQEDQEKIDPFLVSMPSWNEKSGELEYEVKVIPKHMTTERENPIAPQTNVKSYSVKKIICGAFCVVGAGIVFLFGRRKEEDEKI